MADRWETTDAVTRRFGQERHDEYDDGYRQALVDVMNAAYMGSDADYRGVMSAVRIAQERREARW